MSAFYSNFTSELLVDSVRAFILLFIRSYCIFLANVYSIAGFSQLYNIVPVSGLKFLIVHLVQYVIVACKKVPIFHVEPHKYTKYSIILNFFQDVRYKLLAYTEC